MRHLYIILLLLVSAPAANAQFVADTARGPVGQEVRLPLRYIGAADDTLDVITVTGEFLLSNPTVFYPERFVQPNGDSLNAWDLVRLTDSTYTFSFTAPFAPANGSLHDTVALLVGEALAGFDSVCVVNFSNIIANGKAVASASGLVLTHSVGTPLPYVRFATLERNYPNPIRSGEQTTWAYRIDKPSRVIFRFYNIVGMEHITADLGDRPAGVHLFSFTPTIETATGMYIVRMETETGTAFQFMHVIR